ncbi:MAG: SMC-Scp complex subunit ScpB [Methylobacterium mesophilicum]|nr:SMC-Scp complex subunit ScpB [Methylobacterium mesophilicum]
MTAEGADPSEREEALREAMRIVEAILFASAEPVAQTVLAAKLPAGADIQDTLFALARDYSSRGVNLVQTGGGWAFRTADDLAHLFVQERSPSKRLSRAALEVLSVIAYHQPVTRAEIEEVRGVETSKGTLDALMELEWVRMRGRRRSPGRPVTYGTTARFLDHFGLPELRDLPDLDELKGAGLLSPHMPANFFMPLPPAQPDDPSDDEDPLTDIDLEELGLLPPKPAEP